MFANQDRREGLPYPWRGDAISSTTPTSEEDRPVMTLSLSEIRYFNTHLYNIPKSSHWYYEILPSYDDKHFKKY